MGREDLGSQEALGLAMFGWTGGYWQAMCEAFSCLKVDFEGSWECGGTGRKPCELI